MDLTLEEKMNGAEERGRQATTAEEYSDMTITYALNTVGSAAYTAALGTVEILVGVGIGVFVAWVLGL